MSDPAVRFVEIPCRMSVVLVDGEPAGEFATLACAGAIIRVDAIDRSVLAKFVRATVAHHVASSEAAPATDALPPTSQRDAPVLSVHRNAGAASERGERSE